MKHVMARIKERSLFHASGVDVRISVSLELLVKTRGTRKNQYLRK